MSMLRRVPATLWRRSGDRVVLRPTRVNDPIVLDGVGRRVWDLLDEPISQAALTAAFAEHFVRDRADVARELQPFLTDLAFTGAITDRS